MEPRRDPLESGVAKGREGAGRTEFWSLHLDAKLT